MKFSFSSSLEGERLRGFEGNDGQNMNMLMLDYFKLWSMNLCSPLVLNVIIFRKSIMYMSVIIVYNKIEGIQDWA